MKSIMNSEKGIDFLTELRGYTEEHHVFFGNPGRKNSEKYGLKVYLFPGNHRGNLGPHHNRAMDLCLKRLGQIAFERHHGELDLEKDYTVEIKRKRRKRSLDANAYMWVLIGKLAEKLSTPMTPLSDIDIYRQYVKDYGVYHIIPVRDEVIPEWERIWNIRGDGWICENMGPCRTVEGYSNIKSYYGTSAYNTKQMSRLIDAVVMDCKEQGIETLTPEELIRLKAAWSRENG